MLHYNFSDMDYDAMRSVRYQYPEYLSPTDDYMVLGRMLVREHGRDIQRAAGANGQADAATRELIYDDE